MRTIIFTTAVRSYDYGYTVQISPLVGRADMRPVRMVSIDGEYARHQIARYRSGMEMVATAEEWAGLCNDLGHTYEECAPVTSETDLLSLHYQERILEAEQADEFIVEIEKGIRDTILLALGIFVRKSGTTMKLDMVPTIISECSEGSEFWDRLRGRL